MNIKKIITSLCVIFFLYFMVACAVTEELTEDDGFSVNEDYAAENYNLEFYDTTINLNEAPELNGSDAEYANEYDRGIQEKTLKSISEEQSTANSIEQSKAQSIEQSKEESRRAEANKNIVKKNGNVSIIGSNALPVIKSFEAIKKITVNSNSTSFSPNLNALNNVLNSNYKLGFVAVRLSDGASITYNVDESFAVASTIKAGFSLYAAKMIDEGKASFNSAMKYQSRHYYSGSGTVKYSSYGTTYTLKKLIELGITKSDNSAYVMMAEMLGTDGFHNMRSQFGIKIASSQSAEWPNISAREGAAWFNEIYQFRNKSDTGKWLWDQFVGNYSEVAVALNKSKTVAAKSGSNGYSNHEIGIVLGNEPYIFSIFIQSNTGSYSRISYLRSIAKQLDAAMSAK